MSIAAPRPVDPPPPFRFPVIASVAPLVVAVLLWLITGSPYSLLFAVLGPVTAVASVADSRLGARRSSRRERERYSRESLEAREAIDSAHAEERAGLAEHSPSALDLLERTGADPWRWTGGGGGVSIALGAGSIASGVRVDGADDELAGRASVLREAPVIVDAALGVGVCGPPGLARAVARALALRVAWSLPPGGYWCAGDEPWAAALPHANGQLAAGFAQFGPRGEQRALVTIAVAREQSALPAECRVVLALTADGATVVQHPDRSRRGPVRPDAVSAEAALAWALSLVADLPERAAIPDLVTLADLPDVVGSGLGCALGIGASGAAIIDLVADGPHAVVGGTTGSGKSELLVSWVLAMALSVPPERLTVLLVDFKGGSAFADLERLPHTVGIVTDLDDEHAARALASLRAELRYRERRLAEAGARDIDGVHDLPRLVIVVDEFAAMLVEHPDLHALFADIAARGRSLGVHLILCTQRPAGVVRDAVLANADLRISLRVNNRADSTAVVGTDAAADLPSSAKGRGILAPPGVEPRAVQFALATPADVERAASRWLGSPPPRRPWCEPLPPVVTAAEAEGGFALVDLPHEQRRAVASWNAALDGNVLVVGAARSGVSTALAALAPSAVRVPRGVPAAWDVLGELSEARDTVFVVDDLDSLVARFSPDYRPAVVERLAALLRDGPERGLHAALGARRVTADLQQLATLVPERLMLRHASRQDWVLAGADGAHFVRDLPPGGGVWRGDRVQVACVPLEGAERSPAVGVLGTGAVAYVTGRPRAGMRLADVDLSAWREGSVVGDPEEWQSRWGALQSVRRVADVVFEGCSLADVRALTRSRELPPPLDGMSGVGWRWEAGGSLTRVAI